MAFQTYEDLEKYPFMCVRLRPPKVKTYKKYIDTD